MNWAWWVVLAAGVVELLTAAVLVGWWSNCRDYQERLERIDPGCYACLTGGSVTSFAEPSTYRFCRRHKAHWVLIHDLEARERKDALRDRGSGRT